jgi:hypothetical protein
MKNKTVVYTAIFGGKDDLIEPAFIPKGCDFVCFTDRDFESDVWDVRKVEPTFEDPNRSAKMYKILPHRFFSEYNHSVWVDGNLLVRGDINELVKKYLSKVNFAIYSHNQLRKRILGFLWVKDKNECYDCLYKEAEELIKSAKKGNYKDDPNLIKRQVEKYKKEDYPYNNGLVSSMIIFRNHNNLDVIKVGEDWWNEIKNNSRRDQLSFNYVAWKNNLNFKYIKGDSRRNKYFLHTKHRITKYKK